MLLVLVRHGESVWNREHRFTGWTDVELTDRGAANSRRAGRLLTEAGVQPEVCFTSVLLRGVDAARCVLEGMGLDSLPVEQSWRLNERHFGALQSLGRWEAVRRHGCRQVLHWQSSYDVPPPPLAADDPRAPALDPLYKNVPTDELPLTESLADTAGRQLPYWREAIAPVLARGRDVLLVGHKNALRTLIEHLEGLDRRDVPRLKIPTGLPIVYELDDALRVLGRRTLGRQHRRFSRWPGISPA